MKAHDEMLALVGLFLQGQPSNLPATLDIDAFLREASYHGIRPLLYVALKKRTLSNRCELSLRDHLRADVMASEAIDIVHVRELTRVLATLACAGVGTLLMKGTPLAHTHYPAPVLRPRADTDVLIPWEARPTACRVLENFGYELSDTVRGRLVSSEFAYSRRDEHGLQHTLDLHWRISNSQIFSRTLLFDELHEQSVSIPALGEYARGLGNVHALIVACVHRLSHMHAPYYVNGQAHYGDRLIWLYDIHLLGEMMNPEEWQCLVALARKKRLGGVCLDGLITAQKHFGSKLPQDLLDTMAADAKGEPFRVRTLVRSAWQFRLSEFRSLSSWRDRLLLLKEHLLPPTDYMLKRYETNRRALLPALYIHRAIRGLRRR